MAKVWVGKTGKLVQGTVLDCGRKAFERALKDYDSQLYTRWNPKKLKGEGTWEIRRRSDTKQVADIVHYKGAAFVRIEWCENDIVNHVLDTPYLNYSVLTKLQKMDTWNKGLQAHNVAAAAESNLDSFEAAEKEKARKEMLYNGKQIKSEIRDFREMIQSGLNPAEIARHWGK